MPRTPARRLGIAVALSLLCLPGGGAAARGVLLPPNIQGPTDDEVTGTLLGAFAAEVERLSGDAVERAGGGPCPVPAACAPTAEDAGDALERYWIQLSGDASGWLAVAVRLDITGEQTLARATAEGTDVAALGVELARAVSAGSCPGLDVTTAPARAEVYVDGELAGRSPLHRDTPLDAGDHLVRVVARDGATALALIRARAGERALLELDFRQVPPGPRAQERARAWPLLPLLVGGITAAVLVATDPAGVIGPDHRITIVTGGP